MGRPSTDIGVTSDILRITEGIKAETYMEKGVPILYIHVRFSLHSGYTSHVFLEWPLLLNLFFSIHHAVVRPFLGI